MEPGCSAEPKAHAVVVVHSEPDCELDSVPKGDPLDSESASLATANPAYRNCLVAAEILALFCDDPYPVEPFSGG